MRVCLTASTDAGLTKTLSRKEGALGWLESEAGPMGFSGLREGLTALIVKVVHSPLRGVIKGAGLVHVGASPSEQQRGSEVQGRGQRQGPGVGGSPAPLSLVQAAGEGQPWVSTTWSQLAPGPTALTGGRCSPRGRAHDRCWRSRVTACIVAPPDRLGPPHIARVVPLSRLLNCCPERDPKHK